MKKKILGLGLGAVLAGVTLASLTSCGASDVFHIYAWNTEFQGFFYKYVSDEKTTDLASTVHLDGKEVKFTIVPSDNGAYQEALDKALANNDKASQADKVDLFLAEADYILKYTNSDKTKDVSKLSYKDSDGKTTAVNFDDAYQYTVKSVDSNNITLNFIYDDAMLKKYFHDKSRCELLMSATIGDFDEYAKLTGLDEKTYKHISMPSTFDFSQSQIYYSTINKMTYTEKDESFQSIAPQVIDICRFYKNNRGIIQTGSYSNCDMLKMMLPNDIYDRCIFYKGAADKSLALMQFIKYGKEQNDNHILVGPTLIEGLDFPDDLCRFQICIKVPFAHLGNEYVRKKKDLVDGWYQYDALTKICQGIGRGIRHPNDWCKTYILDGCINSLVNKLEDVNALSGRFVEYECI